VGGAPEVALFCGSGTLANDVIAATLASEKGARDGLILVNGEFGARLTRQAARFGLRFRTLRQRWGQPWNLPEIVQTLAADPMLGWVWGVHLESSSGTLNDLSGLRAVAARAGVRLCVDLVSSLGSVPLDLSGIHLASGTSGKGLGAYGGVGIVFAARDCCGFLDPRRVPTYLDLRAAIAERGPRFTIASPLLTALDRALEDYETPGARAARFAHYADLGRFVRRGLKELGLQPVTAEEWAAPVITSFMPPEGWTAEDLAAACRSLGYELAYASRYLRRRNWVQIATMGDITRDDLRPIFAGLAKLLAPISLSTS
jgi:aspartate aminotransferase-like enzyme